MKSDEQSLLAEGKKDNIKQGSEPASSNIDSNLNLNSSSDRSHSYQLPTTSYSNPLGSFVNQQSNVSASYPSSSFSSSSNDLTLEAPKSTKNKTESPDRGPSNTDMNLNLNSSTFFSNQPLPGFSPSSSDGSTTYQPPSNSDSNPFNPLSFVNTQPNASNSYPSSSFSTSSNGLTVESPKTNENKSDNPERGPTSTDSTLNLNTSTSFSIHPLTEFRASSSDGSHSHQLPTTSDSNPLSQPSFFNQQPNASASYPSSTFSSSSNDLTVEAPESKQNKTIIPGRGPSNIDSNSTLKSPTFYPLLEFSLAPDDGSYSYEQPTTTYSNQLSLPSFSTEPPTVYSSYPYSSFYDLTIESPNSNKKKSDSLERVLSNIDSHPNLKSSLTFSNHPLPEFNPSSSDGSHSYQPPTASYDPMNLTSFVYQQPTVSVTYPSLSFYDLTVEAPKSTEDKSVVAIGSCNVQGRTLKVGDKWTVSEICGLFTCQTFEFRQLTTECPELRYQEDSECYVIPQDMSQVFPFCCPKLECSNTDRRPPQSTKFPTPD